MRHWHRRSEPQPLLVTFHPIRTKCSPVLSSCIVYLMNSSLYSPFKQSLAPPSPCRHDQKIMSQHQRTAVLRLLERILDFAAGITQSCGGSKGSAKTSTPTVSHFSNEHVLNAPQSRLHFCCMSLSLSIRRTHRLDRWSARSFVSQSVPLDTHVSHTQLPATSRLIPGRMMWPIWSVFLRFYACPYSPPHSDIPRPSARGRAADTARPVAYCCAACRMW